MCGFVSFGFVEAGCSLGFDGWLDGFTAFAVDY